MAKKTPGKHYRNGISPKDILSAISRRQGRRAVVCFKPLAGRDWLSSLWIG